MTPREERVIALRFGLEDGRSRTLEELGREFNVTRERVRQIESKALRRLRKKYHTWTLKKISGCYRLPVTLDDVYSRAWRLCVYIFLPLSMIVALVSMMMLIMGVDFIF